MLLIKFFQNNIINLVFYFFKYSTDYNDHSLQKLCLVILEREDKNNSSYFIIVIAILIIYCYEITDIKEDTC